MVACVADALNLLYRGLYLRIRGPAATQAIVVVVPLQVVFFMYIRYSFSLEIMGSCARWEIKSAVHLLTASTRGWGWGRESERGWGRGRESERGERAVELSKKKKKVCE